MIISCEESLADNRHVEHEEGREESEYDVRAVLGRFLRTVSIYILTTLIANLVRRRGHFCELPFFIGIAEVRKVRLPISGCVKCNRFEYNIFFIKDVKAPGKTK